MGPPRGSTSIADHQTRSVGRPDGSDYSRSAG
jgi:hypothetical protein